MKLSNFKSFFPPILGYNNTEEAPYAALTHAANLIGSALSSQYSYRYMEQFWEGIRRKSCKVMFLGDSVTENIAQNWPMSHWTVELATEMKNAFPEVAFEFVNLAIGGKIAEHVLGYTAGATLPTDSLGGTWLIGTSGEQRSPAMGSTSPTNPETWQGAASGDAQWANGEVWLDRVKKHNADLLILTFGLNEENGTGVESSGRWWFGVAIQKIIKHIRHLSTFDNYTRPSVMLGTPYNDTVARPLRNQLAEQMSSIAKSNQCPLIDANRWDGIVVEGKDRCRQRWVGESYWRHMVVSKLNNDLDPDRASYWDITGTPNTGAGGTATNYISAGGAPLKLIRKKASRDIQHMIRFNVPSTNLTQPTYSIWYRVDPNNLAVGYELKYSATGTLELFYHDDSRNLLIATKSVYALAVASQAFVIYVRCIGSRHEVWTAFNNTAAATGYAPTSLQQQMSVIHTGAEENLECCSAIFREGYSGIALGSTGTTYGSLTVAEYPTQSNLLSFGYPLPVMPSIYGASLQEIMGYENGHPNYESSALTAHPQDSIGGNLINHMTTDAYPTIYGAAIGSTLRQLKSSRLDLEVLASSGVQIVSPANTAENILVTVKIPAGKLAKNSELEVKIRAAFTGSTNQKTLGVKFGPTFASASTIGSSVTATAANLGGEFTYSVKNRNNYKKQSRLTTSINGNSQTAPGEITVDTTVDNYIYIAATKASGAEAFTVEKYTVTFIAG